MENMLDPCLVIGSDGNVVPKHQLTSDEKAYIVEKLGGWCLASVEGCTSARALASLVGTFAG